MNVPITVSIAEAARITGLSERAIRELLADKANDVRVTFVVRRRPRTTGPTSEPPAGVPE